MNLTELTAMAQEKVKLYSTGATASDDSLVSWAAVLAHCFVAKAMEEK